VSLQDLTIESDPALWRQ